jgi:hypothetical protein
MGSLLEVVSVMKLTDEIVHIAAILICDFFYNPG